jgi:tetratricopeptide (TPR) repeat protein
MQAIELADRLGDPELRVLAYTACSLAESAALHYEEAINWSERAMQLEDEIRDPDLRVELYFNASSPSVGLGDFPAARRYARKHDELNSKLSTHHRVHGVAGVLEVEELLGAWDRVAELQRRTEESVEANVSTPCVRNARSLFLCALARAYEGETEESRRLEERAEEVSFEGFGLTLDAPRIRLALTRDDLELVERLVAGEHSSQAFYLGSQTGLLDGLAAIRDRKRVEAEAEVLLQPGTYLEPFVLRALGLVREDEELVERALARFEALGLDWHAEETRGLVAQA